MIARTFVAVGLSVCMTASALAYENLDGNHLLKACKYALADRATLNSEGDVLAGYCAGMINGVAGARRVGAAASS